MTKLDTFSSIEFLSIFVFVLLALNFATPTLGFLVSMQGQTPKTVFYVEQFLGTLPFIIAAVFYYVLVTKMPYFGGRTLFLLSGQAVLATLILIIWFGKLRSSEIFYIPTVILLYVVWLVMLSLRSKELKLSVRFETLYLVINMVFGLSFALHLFKGVDFSYFFGFDLPPFLSWVFAYTPTLLVSFTSLAAWTLFVCHVKGWHRLAGHSILVFLPVIIIIYARSLRPLFGYVLTSAIVWGSSYEFFYPVELSLSLVLLAITAFVSSSILLKPLCKTRKPIIIRLSVASAVLAGMSSSPLSVIGVLLSLQLLFLGTKPGQDQ
ncbi:MAG: hypothetical protein ACE5IW_12450 [bacterium]